MPILYVTATRTVTYQEKVTEQFNIADIDNIEQIVKDIREGGGSFFSIFDTDVDVTIIDNHNLSRWKRTGYGSNISDMKIDSIKAEIEY